MEIVCLLSTASVLVVLSPPSERMDALRGSTKRSVLREGKCCSYLATASDTVCVASSPDHYKDQYFLISKVPVVFLCVIRSLIGSEALPTAAVTVGINFLLMSSPHEWRNFPVWDVSPHWFYWCNILQSIKYVLTHFVFVHVRVCVRVCMWVGGETRPNRFVLRREAGRKLFLHAFMSTTRRCQRDE